MPKLDIVYLLRDRPSKWANNELRFSLRALEQYFPHGKVFVVSESLPEWARNIGHIPAVDGYENKLMNATSKLRAACRHPDLSERFVLMNDDFFFLRPTPRIETCTIGTLEKMIADHKTQAGYYFAAAKATRDLLQASGIDRPKAYEAHYPMVFEKQKFLAATDAIAWDTHGYLFRSIYGNTYALGGKARPDTKAFSAGGFEKHEDFLSISESVALYPRFQKFIFDKFPMASQYETIESAPAKLP